VTSLACSRASVSFSLILFLSLSLILPIESIYVHECGFELRPLLLSRDYRRKEGRPNQYLTQTFRPRPRRCLYELLVLFEGRSHCLTMTRNPMVQNKISESLINLSFYTELRPQMHAKHSHINRMHVRACAPNVSAQKARMHVQF